MCKSATKRIDEIIADALDLTLSNIAATIKHVQRLDKLVKEFIFAYEKDDVVYYDRAPLLMPDNGMRVKVAKFHIHPCIRERLNQHLYRRWYVRSNDTLYVMQMAKPSALDEYFYFHDVLSPEYRTQTAYTVPETPFIRKKPLLACRPLHPGWGIVLPKISCVRRCAAVA